jgi:hypothetical protein
MIRLQDLITEIGIGGVQPYATQFTWSLNGGHRESEFDADGVPIIFAFTPHTSREWDFAILTPTADSAGWTVAHARSAATGQISYLRLMSTVAEALLDFIADWQPESIDITGSDTSSTEKDLQKTRIYKSMLASNAARLATSGYTWLHRSGKLWIVRKTPYDASGVADAMN